MDSRAVVRIFGLCGAERPGCEDEIMQRMGWVGGGLPLGGVVVLPMTFRERHTSQQINYTALPRGRVIGLSHVIVVLCVDIQLRPTLAQSLRRNCAYGNLIYHVSVCEPPSLPWPVSTPECYQMVHQLRWLPHCSATARKTPVLTNSGAHRRRNSGNSRSLVI